MPARGTVLVENADPDPGLAKINADMDPAG